MTPTPLSQWDLSDPQKQPTFAQLAALRLILLGPLPPEYAALYDLYLLEAENMAQAHNYEKATPEVVEAGITMLTPTQQWLFAADVADCVRVDFKLRIQTDPPSAMSPAKAIRVLETAVAAIRGYAEGRVTADEKDDAGRAVVYLRDQLNSAFSPWWLLAAAERACMSLTPEKAALVAADGVENWGNKIASGETAAQSQVRLLRGYLRPTPERQIPRKRARKAVVGVLSRYRHNPLHSKAAVTGALTMTLGNQRQAAAQMGLSPSGLRGLLLRYELNSADFGPKPVRTTAFRKERVEEALRQTGGNQVQTAKRLGTTPSNVNHLLRTYRLDVAAFRGTKVGIKTKEEIKADPQATPKELLQLEDIEQIAHPNCPAALWWHLAESFPVEAQDSMLYELMTLEEPGRWAEMESVMVVDWIKAGAWRLSEPSRRLFAADCAAHVLPLFEEEYPRRKGPREAIWFVRNGVKTGLFFENGTIPTYNAKKNYEAARRAVQGAKVTAAARAAEAAAYACNPQSSAIHSAIYTAAQARSAAVDNDTERLWQWQRMQAYVRGKA